jgi:hypothetical protein
MFRKGGVRQLIDLAAKLMKNYLKQKGLCKSRGCGIPIPSIYQSESRIHNKSVFIRSLYSFFRKGNFII